MANYTHTTLDDFRTQVKKDALGDSIGVFWPDAEINKLIEQALLTFGALSGLWKDDITIPTEENERIYDIFTDANSVNQVAPTLTYQDVINWLNIDLIETISEAEPTSDLFTLDGLLLLIEKAYNFYQSLTNLVVSNYDLDIAAQNNTVIISKDTINIIRLVHLLDGVETILEFVDEQEIGYFEKSALTEEETPKWFSTIYGDVNEIKLYPIPSNSAKLKVLAINGRDTTKELSNDTEINLPNNLVPYLKYRVLYEIYSRDGLLNNPSMAEYCNKRWEEGISIGKVFSSILIAKANGLIIDTDSLNKLDQWITPISTDDPPTILGLAGFNIFQVDTIPTNEINSILLSVFQNAIIPINDGDFIDVPKEYIKPLLGYVMHIAQTKCGIADLSATNTYFENFVKTGIGHNARLQNRGISFLTLMGKSKKEEVEKPKLVEEAA